MNGMSNSKRSRKAVLADAGLLNPHPETVTDSLFHEHPEFFDPHDLVQVRYETLRAHLMDGEKVEALRARYGVGRQTFYNLLEKFTTGGSAGLLPGKRGPRNAWKLGPDIRTYVLKELERDPQMSGATLASSIQANFKLIVHKRTVEKLLVELRSKKNT